VCSTSTVTRSGGSPTSTTTPSPAIRRAATSPSGLRVASRTSPTRRAAPHQVAALDRRGAADPLDRPAPVETAAGLWEGARYLSTGKYRQGFACIMRVNGAPFCDVASEAIALRYYQGGWGPRRRHRQHRARHREPAGRSGRRAGERRHVQRGAPRTGSWTRAHHPMVRRRRAVAAHTVANGARASFTLAPPPGCTRSSCT
jgi:hypothetical protein